MAPTYFQTIHCDIHTPTQSRTTSHQRHRRRQARPARLHSIPVWRAGPHLDHLEHPRPGPRRNGLDREFHRRLSRGRGEEDGAAQRVERLQDRAPARVPGSHADERRHRLRRHRGRAHAKRHDGPARRRAEAGTSTVGPCRAGGRARREFPGP